MSLNRCNRYITLTAMNLCSLTEQLVSIYYIYLYCASKANLSKHELQLPLLTAINLCSLTEQLVFIYL